MKRNSAYLLTSLVLIVSAFVSVFVADTPATQAATITDVDVLPASTTLGDTTSYTVSFTLPSALSAGTQQQPGQPIGLNFWYNGEQSDASSFGFPKELPVSSFKDDGTAVSGSSASLQEQQEGDDGPPGISVFPGSDLAADSEVSITLTGIQNPSQKGRYSVQVDTGDPQEGGDSGADGFLLGAGETVNLLGQVTYEGTNTAVTDAAVNAFPRTRGEGGDLFLNTDVDSSGNYSLEVPKTGKFEVRVEPQWGDNNQVAVDWAFAGQGQVVDTTSYAGSAVNLEVVKATATVKGKVVGPNGSAVGAWVDVRGKDGAGVGGSASPDTGAFSVSVPAGSYNVGIFGDDQTLTAPAINSFSVVDGGTKDLGTIKMAKKSSKIKGKVIDKDSGAGIAGVRVNAWVGEEGGGWGETTTGSDGSYELLVGAGTWEVMVEPEPSLGYAATETGPPTRIKVSKDQTITGRNFKLVKANNTIQGKVLDSNGDQVTGFFGFAMVFEGAGDPPKPGPGGPAEGGQFQIAVPDGTWTVNVETEPGSDYSMDTSTDRTVSVKGGQTKTVNVTMKQNDASISGTIKDGDGNAVTGVRAEVFAENGRGSFKMADVDQSTGKYSLGVVGGDNWYLGVFVEPDSGYMMLPPSDSKTTVNSGASVTKNFSLLKANATISGKVTDPSGNGLSGVFVFADTNLVDDGAVLGLSTSTGGPMDGPGGKLDSGVHTGDLTDGDGNFTLEVPAGTYGVGSGAPASLGYINPKFAKVTVGKNKTASNTNLQYRASDATISGTVKLGGEKTEAFVWAWSETGAHSESFTRTGEYTLNVTKGEVWHVGADYETNQKFYQSNEQVIDLSSVTSATQNLTLSKTDFTVPPSVSQQIQAASGGTIVLEDGLRVVVPAGAFGSSGTYTVTVTPTAQLTKEKSRRPLAFGYQISAVDSSGQAFTQSFNSNVRLIMPYTDAMLTALGITEDNLNANFFDSTSSAWQGVDSFTVNKDDNTVVASVSHFTDFALTTGAGSAVTPTPTPTNTPTPTATPTPTSAASLPATGVPIGEAISFYLTRLLGLAAFTAPAYVVWRKRA